MDVLRSVLRLVVVLSLVLSTQGLLLVQGAYVLRQDFIAEHLCVNRDKPEENCHGKCHLRQQLERQQRQDEERQAASLILLIGGTFLVVEAEVPPKPDGRAVAYTAPPETLLPAPPPTEVFHPPQAA